MTLAPVQYLVSCSLASTTMVRSTMAGATGTIGRLRRTLVLIARVVSTSIVVASVQPMAAIGITGIASGASSQVSLTLAPNLLPNHPPLLNPTPPQLRINPPHPLPPLSP